MPTEQTSRRALLTAIAGTPSIAELLTEVEGHFNYELDLEVIVYGRNYNGKQVGPYVRLLHYAAGDVIVREGEWGGNAFYLIVEGSALVTINEQTAAQLGNDSLFGQTALLAGVPHNATVTAGMRGVQLLEVQRPALRLLRKLPRFSATLNATNRTYNRDLALDALAAQLKLSATQTETLRQATRFITLAKQHVLLQQGEPATRLYLIKEGWLRRVQTEGRHTREDIIGPGFCFGLRALQDNTTWPYSITLLGRAELLEISAVKLRNEASLRELLRTTLPRYRAPILQGADKTQVTPENAARKKASVSLPVLQAQRQLIEKGLTDATNLLVMDMELCVRCGNCSLACHEMHGHTRLVRHGIHLTRPQASFWRATQSLLAPEACLHCQDPECLTGCPTGAIGRLADGQIDINAKTCIGCGDCATQCPYDAITMLPRNEYRAAQQANVPAKVTARLSTAPAEKSGARNGKAPADNDLVKSVKSDQRKSPNPKQLAASPQPLASNYWHGFQRFLRLRPEPLPAAVQDTEDLVAVKCNLCADRVTLNAPGSATRKYSCEENCPTGALARVNPRDYFTELKPIEGELFMAIKAQRLQMRLGGWWHRADWPKRWLHLAGALSVLLSVGLALAGLRRYGLGQPLFSVLGIGMNLRWLTGWAGLVALAFVMTYPVRRQIYRRRAGALRYWLPVHTWASTSAALLFLLHGGSHAGGWLTFLLMICFDLVILTGVFGIVWYYVAPRLLTQLEETPLLLDDLLARRRELQDELTDAAAHSPALRTYVESELAARYLSFRFLVRQFTRRESLDNLLRRTRRDQTATQTNLLQAQAAPTLQALGLSDRSEQSLQALDETSAADYLRLRLKAIGQREQFNALLAELRVTRETLNQAHTAAVVLRRVDALVLLQRLLKAWLPPHIITSALMLALLAIHLLQVFYFAAR